MIRVYPTTPVPAPRQVLRDKYDPSPMVVRYRSFQDEIRWRKVTIPTPFHHVIFVMPMAASWPAKRKLAMMGMPHQQTPDRDNLEKALLDSVFGQDCQIWNGQATKLWGPQGMVIVSDAPLEISLPFDFRPYIQAMALTGNTPFKIDHRSMTV